MYPGLFGEDSLITLGQARSGNVDVWFTAWWVYIIDALTFGTRAIPLLTLCGVLLLSWSIREWAVAIFPRVRARAWAIALICATPLVGALGIQVRHDAWMVAGFLLCLAVITRRYSSPEARWRAIDYLQLLLAIVLIPTRHNGLGTLIAAAVIGLIAIRHQRVRFAFTIAIVAIGVFVVTQLATRAAGREHSIDPVQAVEWMMADVSCLTTDPSVELTDEQWRAIEPIASRSDWQEPVACRFVSPLLIAPTFRAEQVEPNMRGLARTWWTLAMRYPLKMIAVHLRRVNLFLPPFIGGAPTQSNTPFLHSTILPNDFDLRWAFPRIAEAARLPVRAWNAMRAVLANAALWLAVLLVIAWRRRDLRTNLMPTIVVCVALEAGLLATAPISEGRYGLLILVTGQLAALYLALERWQTRRMLS
jgi:hypothetical protein